MINEMATTVHTDLSLFVTARSTLADIPELNQETLEITTKTLPK